MRDVLAAVLCELVVESVCEWCVGGVSGGGVLVGVAVSVGMVAVPYGSVVVLPVAGMGMAAGWSVEGNKQYRGDSDS
jgi:hypothetical protein